MFVFSVVQTPENASTGLTAKCECKRVFLSHGKTALVSQNGRCR